MRCPNCNTENEQNSIFCKNCNAWILAEVYTEDTPATAEEVPTETAKSKKSTKWLIPVIAGTLAVIVLVFLLLKPVHPQHSNGYIHYQDHIASHTFGNSRVTAQNGTILRNGSSAILTRSLDGGTALFESGNNLMLIQNGQVSYVDNHVSRCVLSVNGKGIVYAKDGKAFYYYYSAETGQSQPFLASNDFAASYQAGSFTISPDGQTIVYLRKAQAYSVYLWQNGQDAPGTVIASYDSSPRLISVSNGGECIYLYLNGRLYSLDWEGNVTTVAESQQSPASGLQLDQVGDSFHLNADHTQLLYQQGSASFISENGKPGQMVSGDWIEPLLPAQTIRSTQNGCHTYPHYDFYGQIHKSTKYTTSDNILGVLQSETTLVLITDEGDARTILKSPSKYWLSPDGCQLYCTDQNYDLLHITITDRSGFNTATIASQVSSFAVTADCSMVYFVSDRQLYRCNGSDGTQRLFLSTGESIHSLAVTPTGELYCIIDNYLCRCLDEVQLLMPSAQVVRIHAAENGLVFVRTQETMLVSSGNCELVPLSE